MRPAAVVSLALALISDQAATPQRFTSGVELITVDTLVTDGRKPVSGLSADDFELRDNGVVQRITQLEVARLPLNVILALDVSASVQGPRFAHLREAAASIVGRLRTQDKVALITFAQEMRLRAPLTSDRGQVTRALDQLTTGGTTALRDAAYGTIALRGDEPGRALVVLFTDGMDNASFLDERRVFNAIRRSDVIVYPVGVRMLTMTPTGPVRRAPTVDDEEFLQALANDSGGRLVIAEGDADIGPAFTRILDEFNSRYVLAYSPSGVGKTGWHQVDVRLKSKKGTVTARRGYFEK